MVCTKSHHNLDQSYGTPERGNLQSELGSLPNCYNDTMTSTLGLMTNIHKFCSKLNIYNTGTLASKLFHDCLDHGLT